MLVGRSTSLKKQRGLSLVLAIFILVILSLLGASMVNLMMHGAESTAREVIASRALLAAESGAERKLNEVFPPNGGAGGCGAAAIVTYDAVDLGGLDGCSNLSVNVSCRAVDIDGTNYYFIASTASCGPAGDQAVRTVQLQAKDVL